MKCTRQRSLGQEHYGWVGCWWWGARSSRGVKKKRHDQTDAREEVRGKKSLVKEWVRRGEERRGEERRGEERRGEERRGEERRGEERNWSSSYSPQHFGSIFI